jgi:hypothetical protein
MEIEVIRKLVAFDDNYGYGIKRKEEKRKKIGYEIKTRRPSI